MPRRAVWRDGWWAFASPRPSPHSDERPPGTAVSLVVLHSISLPPGEFRGDAVQRLFQGRLDCGAHPYYDRLRGLRVSAHFLVRRSGRVLQFVSCDRRAWHAGVSRWRGRAGCNDFSVGIELEGLEGGAFEPAQYRALVPLLRQLHRRYPLQAVTGHEHIAPGRKGDPGPGFDWSGLASALQGSGMRPLLQPRIQGEAVVPAGDAAAASH